MIKRVEIKGFRSCKDVVIDNLGNLTALIGRNASGKTAILKAIEWAARSATEPEFLQARVVESLNRLVRAKLHVYLEDKQFRYTREQKLDETSRKTLSFIQACGRLRDLRRLIRVE